LSEGYFVGRKISTCCVILRLHFQTFVFYKSLAIWCTEEINNLFYEEVTNKYEKFLWYVQQGQATSKILGGKV